MNLMSSICFPLSCRTREVYRCFWHCWLTVLSFLWWNTFLTTLNILALWEEITSFPVQLVKWGSPGILHAGVLRSYIIRKTWPQTVVVHRVWNATFLARSFKERFCVGAPRQEAKLIDWLMVFNAQAAIFQLYLGRNEHEMGMKSWNEKWDGTQGQ